MVEMAVEEDEQAMEDCLEGKEISIDTLKNVSARNTISEFCSGLLRYRLPSIKVFSLCLMPYRLSAFRWIFRRLKG